MYLLQVRIGGKKWSFAIGQEFDADTYFKQDPIHTMIGSFDHAAVPIKTDQSY